MLEEVYAQNHRRLKDYYEAVEKSQSPLEKGIALTLEDKIRREIIMELMCHFHAKFDSYCRQNPSALGSKAI
ncbi:MAG: hypothetical protein VKN60_07180 [Cyanobacteriota bacterium]|nr:hypothetical protein [Cyanobacteriota bacterium]